MRNFYSCWRYPNVAPAIICRVFKARSRIFLSLRFSGKNTPITQLLDHDIAIKRKDNKKPVKFQFLNGRKHYVCSYECSRNFLSVTRLRTVAAFPIDPLDQSTVTVGRDHYHYFAHVRPSVTFFKSSKTKQSENNVRYWPSGSLMTPVLFVVYYNIISSLFLSAFVGN